MKRLVFFLAPILALVLAACSVDGEPDASVADLVSSYGELDTLNQAVTAAGLAEALGGDGEFTVFAPTEEGFDAFLDEYNAALQECIDRSLSYGPRLIVGPGFIPGSVEDSQADLDRGDLLALAEAQPGFLADLLLYHVVDGEYMAADLVAADGDDLATLLAEAVVTVDASDGVSLVDQAGRTVNVVASDYEATNGVVHFIDSVLLPFELIPNCSEPVEQVG